MGFANWRSTTGPCFSERLEPTNSCREVLGRLILHARDELAERARGSGA